MICDRRRTAVAAALHSPQLLCARRVCRRGSVGINMPRMPMLPQIKALRAQHRREDTAYANQQLNASIVHKSNCLKRVMNDSRKVVACDMHCAVKRL